MSHLQEYKVRFEQQGAKVYAISADSTKDLAKLKKRLSLTFPLLSDTPLVATRLFGVEHVGSDISLPAVFIIDKTGKIRWHQVSKDVLTKPKEADLLDIVTKIAQNK